MIYLRGRIWACLPAPGHALHPAWPGFGLLWGPSRRTCRWEQNRGVPGLRGDCRTGTFTCDALPCGGIIRSHGRRYACDERVEGAWGLPGFLGGDHTSGAYTEVDVILNAVQSIKSTLEPKIDALRIDMDHLREDLKKLKERVATTESTVSELRPSLADATMHIKDLQKEALHLQQRLEDQEGRSRHNNIRVEAWAWLEGRGITAEAPRLPPRSMRHKTKGSPPDGARRSCAAPPKEQATTERERARAEVELRAGSPMLSVGSVEAKDKDYLVLDVEQIQVILGGGLLVTLQKS
ncbi:hypothetical protein NDU88_007760 [Pleurodeles waltl]|uniref:Uncharacterized protein n=1 Tax=Pleurodeles waltl TaxID=8319 RepID=A0AAV7QPR5_PLEWA|nr:hypothetical protein NDU88_007760 [Pleurodeles waltl]